MGQIYSELRIKGRSKEDIDYILNKILNNDKHVLKLFLTDQSNLYNFVTNSPIYYVDVYGLKLIYGPDNDVNKNDSCCLEVKDYWQAYYASKDDCVMDCMGGWSSLLAQGLITVGSGIAAFAITNPVGQGALGIVGTATGGYGLGSILACPLICERNTCSSQAPPTPHTYTTWYGKCKTGYKCPAYNDLTD
jgi:hypothetical protein